MICIDDIVKNLISSNPTINKLVNEEVYCIGEDIKKIIYPRIGFEEISNVPCGFSDDNEEATAITYRFYIYDKDFEQLIIIVNELEKSMKEYGFVRKQTNPLTDDCPHGICGKELIMRIIIGY